MNKIYTLVFIALLAVGFTACEDDDCDQFHIDTDMMGIPTVMKGTFPVGVQIVAIGDSVVFAPQLMDTTRVTYSWNVNGEEVSADSAFTFKVEKPCRAKLVCTLENSKGKVIMESDITSKHDLTKGLIIVKNNSLDFYDPETGKIYSDVFSSLNFGNGIKSDGNGKFQTTLINGKLYVSVSTSTSNIDHLYIIDPLTFYKETSVSLGANLVSFIPLNNQQALINIGGLTRMDLTTLTKTVLFDKYGWVIYNSMIFNGKLLVNNTYKNLVKVGYFNVNDLLTAQENNQPDMKQLEIVQNGKFNFVKAKDGNAYTIGFDETNTTYYLAKITNDLSVTKVPLSFVPAKSLYAGGNTLGMVSSIHENAIFIIANDQTIYKYVIGDQSSLNSPFISAVPESFEISGNLQIDPATGKLYVLYQKKVGYDKYIGKIDIYGVSGQLERTMDCGDGTLQSILFNN